MKNRKITKHKAFISKFGIFAKNSESNIESNLIIIQPKHLVTIFPHCISLQIECRAIIPIHKKENKKKMKNVPKQSLVVSEYITIKLEQKNYLLQLIKKPCQMANSQLKTLQIWRFYVYNFSHFIN